VSTASSAPQSGQAQRDSPTGTLRSAPHTPQGSRAPRTSAAPRGSGSAFRRGGGGGMSSGGSDCGVAQSGQMNSVRPRSTSSVSPHPAHRTSRGSAAAAAAPAAGGGGAIAFSRQGGVAFFSYLRR